MSVSKKIRFEVFKRDGFQCAYCGKTPPEVTLECDHIEPVSKGGSDDMDNLITACFDCNRGKTNIPLDKASPKLSENTKVIKERESQIKEYRKEITKAKRRIKRDINKIDIIFAENYPGRCLSDKFKRVTLNKFIKSIPLDEIEDAMSYACSRIDFDEERAVKYFCGICWNKIRGTE